MTVSARGHTRSRTARLLPSVTQRAPAMAAVVRERGRELSRERGLAGPGPSEDEDPVAAAQAGCRVALDVRGRHRLLHGLAWHVWSKDRMRGTRLRKWVMVSAGSG